MLLSSSPAHSAASSDTPADAAVPAPRRAVADAATPHLVVKGLSAMGDRGTLALHGIDLAVRGGEILGVAGVSGNGQRELVEALVGQRRRLGGEVRVLGTQFEVREQGDGAQVTVRSGRVAVTPVQGEVARELTANQQLTYAAGRAGQIEAVDSDSRLAWRQGWLSYQQVPLADVLEDLRRYYPGRIVLLDDTLGQRLVSASIPANQPLLALDSLGKVMGFSRQTVLGRLTLVR